MSVNELSLSGSGNSGLAVEGDDDPHEKGGESEGQREDEYKDEVERGVLDNEQCRRAQS